MDNAKEIWKDCIHYEGLYQVSNLGRVWDIKNQRLLKQFGNPYLTVSMRLPNGKVCKERVHRLVALNFVKNPNPKEFTCVNHIDENKHNNRSDNLEWCTLGYNTAYSRKKCTGWTHSEETKKKISESHKGIKPSKESREKMSKSHQGKPHPSTIKGRHWKLVDGKRFYY